MEKRKHVAHELYKAPATTPQATRCVRVVIPDSEEWMSNLRSAIFTLTTWINYRASGTTRESEVAQIWRDVLINLSSCDLNLFEGVSLVPIGTIVPWAGQIDAIPTGWLYCDGSFFEPLDYPDLYATIDPSFYRTIEIAPGITVDGFIVPDLRAAFPLGTNIPPGNNVNLSDRAMGENGGSESVSLSASQMPSHSHVLPSGILRRVDNTSPSVTLGSAGTQVGYNQTITSNSSGSGVAHENMPPFIALHYIIKATLDEITGQPGQDGELTMLRQNPTNPYHLEQSFDTGQNWSLAFDYELIKQRSEGSSTDIDIINFSTTYNEYLETINNTYGGDVTNIYPEAIYDNTADDQLRDLTLCWTIKMVFDTLKETYAIAAERHEEKPTLFDLIEAATVAASAIVVGATATAAAFATGGLPLAIATAIIGVDQTIPLIDEFEDQWHDFWSNPDEFRNVDLSDNLCCIFSALQGQTISESLWSSAFLNCINPLPDESIFSLIIHKTLEAMGTNDKIFAVWLDILNTGFIAQKAGVVFDDCPCLVDCQLFNFAASGTDLGWTVINSVIAEEGIRGTPAPTYGNAQGIYDFGNAVFLKSIEVDWYCPRTDDAQFIQWEVSDDGINWTIKKRLDFQPVGRQTDKWSGDEFKRYVKISAIGSTVNQRSGQIFSIKTCYINP